MPTTQSHLTALTRAAIEPLGYELVGVEHMGSGSPHAVVRVYIDRPDAEITLHDCEQVSRQLSAVFDVEDPISGHYDLEVSSPGLDRPLFTLEQMVRFRGHCARIKLCEPLEGRRNFEGQLAGADGELLMLEIDGEVYKLPVDQIASARLVPQF